MTARTVVPRQKAEQDIDDAIDYYYGEGGANLALAFIDALEVAFQYLAAHAESGSPRYAIELDLPGLRYWPLKKFPYLIFYVETEIRVDVWRVLHGKRHIPPTMQGTSE
jgi:toxin ParE1/3/4